MEREIRARVIVRAAALIALVLAFGTAFYVVVEGAPLRDAFYFVAMDITLVGSSYTPKTALGTAVAVLLAFVSVGLILSLVAQVFGPQVGEFIRRRARVDLIASRKDHVIVTGASDTSWEVAEKLKEAAVLVVENDADEAEAERRGLAALRGDPSRARTLEEAGLARARMLVAASDSDAENAFTCITARRLAPKLRIVVRIAREESREKMQEVGADEIVCPPTLAAERILREATGG